MNVLIIEDEILTAQDIAKSLKKLDESIQIYPIIESVKEGIHFLGQGKPIDLIFSDIELGDGLSFEIFTEVPVQIPIIFCTAYEDYTLKAFESFGISYILKPFSVATIENSLKKYHSLTSLANNNTAETYNELIEKLNEKKSAFIVHKGDKIIPIKINDIALFYIEEGQVFLRTFDRTKFRMKKSMDELEQELPKSFFRANRQVILNRSVVVDANQYFSRKLVANLSIKFPEKVIIGKLKAGPFLDWLAMN